MARPSPDHLYFLDENMDSADLAALLAKAGMSCVRISKAGSPFRVNMTDEDWIPLVAARGWWGLTRDGATLKNPEESRAIDQALAVHIVLRGTHLTIAEMAAAMIDAHHTLCMKIAKLTRPTILDVHRDGRVVVRKGERRGGRPKP